MTVRTLHLVDLENLAGDPRASERDALAAYVDYLRAADWRAGDVVYLAMNPGLAKRIGWASVVPCRLHCACGTDGADLALLAHAAPEFVARRFERLVVGSGDHIFVPAPGPPRSRGRGQVVSRPASLSHEWHRAGFTICELTSRTLGRGRTSTLRRGRASSKAAFPSIVMTWPPRYPSSGGTRRGCATLATLPACPGFGSTVEVPSQ